MTAHSQDNCESCGQDIHRQQDNEHTMAPPPNPHRDTPRNAREPDLHQQVALLDTNTTQLDTLLQSVKQGEPVNQEMVAQLEGVSQNLRPRHGLCIDPKCAACRVHEEVIKEHVLLYVDWKVPGTIVKLEQARHRN